MCKVLSHVSMQHNLLASLDRGPQTLPNYRNAAKITGQNLGHALFSSWLDRNPKI